MINISKICRIELNTGEVIVSTFYLRDKVYAITEYGTIYEITIKERNEI